MSHISRLITDLISTDSRWRFADTVRQRRDYAQLGIKVQIGYYMYIAGCIILFRNPKLTDAFRQFLKSEMSEENLDFYLGTYLTLLKGT